jgi:hypothetical protein
VREQFFLGAVLRLVAKVGKPIHGGCLTNGITLPKIRWLLGDRYHRWLIFQLIRASDTRGKKTNFSLAGIGSQTTSDFERGGI